MIGLGRSIAVKTFTRFNNKSIQSCNSGQASTQRVTTRPSCVAGFKRALFLVPALIAAIFAFSASAVSSATAAPAAGWSVESTAPTYLAPGGRALYEVLVRNTGNGPAAEATVIDELPVGVEFREVHFYWSKLRGADLNSAFFCPAPVGRRVTCGIPALLTGVDGPIEPDQTLPMVIEGNVPSSTPEGAVINEASVEGAGAKASGSAQSTVISHPQFGFTKLTGEPTEKTEETLVGEDNGQPSYEFANKPYRTPFTQAGGHPWGLTTTGEFTTEVNSEGSIVATHDVKDIVTDLPPGLLGDPMAVPRCPLATLAYANVRLCPADTQVGVYRLNDFGHQEYLAPIVNVTPEAGQSAEFVLENTTPVYEPILTAHLVRRREAGVERYSFTVVSQEIPQIALKKFELTFWGVPADPSHDPARGRVCRKVASVSPFACEGGGEHFNYAPSVPFISMPTDCAGGPESFTARGFLAGTGERRRRRGIQRIHVGICVVPGGHGLRTVELWSGDGCRCGTGHIARGRAGRAGCELESAVE